MAPAASIENYVRKFVVLTDEELATFTAAFKEVKAKKRQFLIQPNFVARHRYFVVTIINTGSVVSTLDMPTALVYSTTKYAIDGITRILAKELGPKKIRVNSINPGLIETEGTHTSGVMGGPAEQWHVAETPLGRVGKPTDIARVAVFLASEDAYWVNGELITVSGGQR
jgi:NAD(P)-dependent dehydrogenase (short-subunit alcohol dehydrogenase family)